MLAISGTDLIMALGNGGKAPPFGPVNTVRASHAADGAGGRIIVAGEKADKALP